MKARHVALVFALVVLMALALAQPAWAQCAMCKAALESSAEGRSSASQLNLGILVLLIPPVAIFSGLFGLIYRYRNNHGGKHSPERS